MTRAARGWLIAFILFGAFAAYDIAYSSPAARPRTILFVAIASLTVVAIALLQSRKRSVSPENPRLSPITLAIIALIVILLAVIFRYV
jgi:hypothetical protein